MKKWQKLFLGASLVLAISLVSYTLVSVITPSAPPDNEYTRLLAEAVKRGDLRMPRVPGKYVHFRIRTVLPGKVVSTGQVELWLGSTTQESVQIELDSQGKEQRRVVVNGNKITWYDFVSNRLEENIYDSADNAALAIEGHWWGHRQWLKDGIAKLTKQTANTVVIRIESPNEGTDEITLDRQTYLPIAATYYGVVPIQWEYQSIEITADLPPAVTKAPPVRRKTQSMTLQEARNFSQYSLYYLGEEFAGTRPTYIQYTYEKSVLADEYIVVNFEYLRPGQPITVTHPYLMVKPKSAKDSGRGDSSITNESGDMAMQVWLDDAVVVLHGPDEATLRAMRANLRRLTATGESPPIPIPTASATRQPSLGMPTPQPTPVKPTPTRRPYP